MQQADDLIDGLMLFRFDTLGRILTSMTGALMYWYLLCCSHGLRFYGKLGRVRPVSQAYYESEKLFFGDALAVPSSYVLTIVLSSMAFISQSTMA